MNRTFRGIRCQNYRSLKTPERALTDTDSRTVATEVGISQEVCNDLPAESLCP